MSILMNRAPAQAGANSWELLKGKIMIILRNTSSGLSFEEMYRTSYNMTVAEKGEIMYNGIKEIITQFLREAAPRDINTSRDEFLASMSSFWQRYDIALTSISDIFHYMDRVYVHPQNHDSVRTVGMKIFYAEVIEAAGIKELLQQTLLPTIAADRRGEAISRVDLKSVCTMLAAFDTRPTSDYKTLFEAEFLREWTEFYRTESQRFLLDNNVNVYLDNAEQFLAQEADRADMCLPSTTKEKILLVAEREFITKHADTIINMENSGLVYMFINGQMDELKRLYGFLKRADDGVKKMAYYLSRFLRLKLQDLVDVMRSERSEREPNNPTALIENMISLKVQFDHFITEVFNSDNIFAHETQKDFEYFLSMTPRSAELSAELFSLHIDNLIRKGTKQMSDAQAEDLLDKSMVLFCCIEKEDFAKFYRYHLAKRLLLQKDAPSFPEKIMISKLKKFCGTPYTYDLDRMVTDIEKSYILMSDYKNHQESHEGPAGGIDMSVRILTKRYWPKHIADAPCCQLPPPVAAAFQQFSEFYLSKHEGRILALNPGLGYADVKAVFYGTTMGNEELGGQNPEQATSSMSVARKEEHKILQVNTYQMIVLMRFNERDRFTFQELLDDTQIPERELKRVLYSMAMGDTNQRVLLRHLTNGKEIEPCDEFSVNDGFTSNTNRIRIKMSVRCEAEPNQEGPLSRTAL
uniref:CULLIN_2 domain-containing protein n=1 Tax=Steinernema glaseri TaxID=37863 RepID=A0A1I7ZEL2_9BILA